VGTVRTFDPVVQDLVEQRLKRAVQRHCPGFGATATRALRAHLSRHHQHRSEAVFAADVAESLVGADHVVRDLEPSMGAEDFSFMLQVKPGAYLRIGQGTAPGQCFLHNSRYDFNDEILPLGSALHASLIEQAMPLPMP
jgi:metal-dependent amidase/aminoacylase/carboxypeptidase family protein